MKSSSTATGCSVLFQAATARLRTRNGKDWTGSFPSLAAAMEKLKVKDAVLDMEAVIVDEKGKSSFQALQAALGDGGKPENIVAYVFDLLHLDGKDLTRLPLTERKEKLENLLKKSKQETLAALQRAYRRRGRGHVRQSLRSGT